MIILNSIKKFLEWVFSRAHWKKSLILLAVIALALMGIFKDCQLKTKNMSCGTDTKLDMDKVKKSGDRFPIDKIPVQPAQQ